MRTFRDPTKQLVASPYPIDFIAAKIHPSSLITHQCTQTQTTIDNDKQLKEMLCLH